LRRGPEIRYTPRDLFSTLETRRRSLPLRRFFSTPRKVEKIRPTTQENAVRGNDKVSRRNKASGPQRA
ncbi:MAG: hypothetical protein IJN32_06330, partial [Thermoguttaceae bacterium]|nr:hypothetical protein [Thermoguttaceae bacterium]